MESTITMQVRIEHPDNFEAEQVFDAFVATYDDQPFDIEDDEGESFEGTIKQITPIW